MIARLLDTTGQQTRGQEEFPLNDDREELQANKGMKDMSQARKKFSLLSSPLCRRL